MSAFDPKRTRLYELREDVLLTPPRWRLALVFALIEGLGLLQIAARILHEFALSVGAAEAVGLALDSRIHGAIRLHVLVVDETPATHIAEFPIRGIGRGGKSNDERIKRRAGVDPRHC